MKENYAIFLLENALRHEIIAQADSVNYLLGTHAHDNATGPIATRKAFEESGRIADERIPQLQKAINLLRINFDEFTNDYKHDESTGKRPAVQPNVIG